MDIVSFRHKGLRRFFEHGETRGVPQERVERLRRILTAIDSAERLEELETLPGWRLHPLRGERRGTWSISLSGNWRLTFTVEDDRIHHMDLEDYH
jgi:proteic killer suppression protein